MTRILIFLMLALFVSCQAVAGEKPLMVFAGSASQPPLEEAAKAFEKKTGIPVTLHLGGSGAMLSQIRPDRPIGDDLLDNLFDARIVDIPGFGGTHTLTVALADSGGRLDVELPNRAFRDLGFAIGDSLRIALRRRSLWMLPMNSASHQEVGNAQL